VFFTPPPATFHAAKVQAV